MSMITCDEWCVCAPFCRRKKLLASVFQRLNVGMIWIVTCLWKLWLYETASIHFPGYIKRIYPGNSYGKFINLSLQWHYSWLTSSRSFVSYFHNTIFITWNYLGEYCTYSLCGVKWHLIHSCVTYHMNSRWKRDITLR